MEQAPQTKGRSLRERLEEESLAGSQVLPNMPCALRVRQPCCKGRGFIVRPLGPFAHAELCVCVQTCKSCLGKAQQVVNNSVKPCRNRDLPPPRRFVNLFNQAKIPARYSSAHMNTFENKTGNLGIIVNGVKVWLRHYLTTPEKKGLILTGSAGVGKTYMLAAIAKALIEKNVSVRFVDFFQLVSQIKGGYAENKSEQDILASMLSVDVLIIDELGKGRNSEFEATVLDQLVMNRYNENKILIASTNLTIHQNPIEEEDASKSFHYLGSLEKRVDARAFSRLLEMTEFIEMDGEDYRRQAVKT